MQARLGQRSARGTVAHATTDATTETPAQRAERQAVEAQLQRVVDDPGELLRRRFLLDYQRRQEEGAPPP